VSKKTGAKNKAQSKRGQKIEWQSKQGQKIKSPLVFHSLGHVAEGHAGWNSWYQ
jgi:hypothetical protein